MSGRGTLFEAGLTGRTLDFVEVVDMHGHYGAMPQYNLPHYGPEDLLSEMDRIGIDRIIMSAFRALATDAESGNREMVEVCERHPERFLMHFVVNPHRAGRLDDDFAPYRGHPLVKGLKLHCEVHGYPMAGEAYAWAWRTASETGLPLLVHTFPPRDLPAVPKLADEYPEAKFVVAHHFGPENLDAALPLIRDKANVSVDTCVSFLPPGTVERLVRELGEKRVLFGTDMPYLNAGGQIGKVLLADLDDAAKKKILAENAKRLFNL